MADQSFLFGSEVILHSEHCLKTHFLEWKFINFNKILMKYVAKGSTDLTIDNLVWWGIYASLCSMS